MICTCCGLPISQKKHQTSQGYICDRCWNDPNLFFPEKIASTERGAELLDIYSNSQESMQIPVIKLNQKNVELYTGKLKVRQLLNLYAVHNFQEDTLEGYQRDLYDDQVSELYEYLKECPIAIMPGLLISVRENLIFTPEVESTQLDFGTLDIPLNKGAIWIIDGQHRVSTFEKFLSNIGNFNYDTDYESSIDTFLDYEIPVTFVNSKQAVEKINNEDELSLVPPDIERAVFYIINKTQKRISPSLADTLQYCISSSGIKGIPSIEKEAWRSKAAAVGISMNSDPQSSLFKKINISGQRGLNRPLQLNSFVTSLKPILKNERFNELNYIQQKELINNYWKSIEKINRTAFSKEKYRNHLLLKSVGVYTLNLLLIDYINNADKKRILNGDSISEFVNYIKDFNWEKETSSIAHFGGMSGVREAHRIIINYMKGKGWDEK